MNRSVKDIIEARQTSDGAGVRLRRSLGLSTASRPDPFLMLDEFDSDSPDDYIGGFPSHPHRGFETVTLMLEGRMLHEDHLGNRGELRPGDVQWMTAGAGIIHSEMPQQQEGRLRGFQLWINLPASEKMKPPSYRDISAEEIPSYHPGEGIAARVIAGRMRSDDDSLLGPVVGVTVDPTLLDVHMNEGRTFALPVSETATVVVYVYEGGLQIQDRDVQAGQAAVLTLGSSLQMLSNSETRLLLLCAEPLGEPVAHYGPFVMNTQEQIERALSDYRDGKLAWRPDEVA